MRIKNKPSTAHCTEQMYNSYLLSDTHYISYMRLSEVMSTVSHDSINRFLECEGYELKDLFDKEKTKIELIGGILSVDDSVLGKSYSNPNKVAFINNFWSYQYSLTTGLLRNQKTKLRIIIFMRCYLRFFPGGCDLVG